MIDFRTKDQKVIENLNNQIRILEEANSFLSGRIFEKCRTYTFYVGIAVDIPCDECGIPVTNVFSSAKNFRQSKGMLNLCVDCVEDIPF